VFAGAARAWWAAYADAIRETLGVERAEPRAVRHSLGCLLARVAGRSCLEYLSAEERERQRCVVVRLMGAPPGAMAELIGRFTEEI
jgi:pimeloyl-ACP methyl ester carboxylesterase